MPAPVPQQHDPAWYAIYTRSRHEKAVQAYLEGQKLETFLPVRSVRSAWSDRTVTIQVPALPGYVFVHCTLYAETRALIKKSSGVLRLIENAGRPAAIPLGQIESLRTALAHSFDPMGHPFLKVGDRVRVIRGPMKGVEGFLVRSADSRHRLVISVDYVNQSLSVEIDAWSVERAG